MGKNCYNNYNDVFAGLEILQSLKEKAATVVIKHATLEFR